MSIWTDGIKIERDNGIVIELTPQEIGNINYLLNLEDGRNSVRWFLDNLDVTEEENQKYFENEEKILNDDILCYNIFCDYTDNVYYDTGELEYDIVKDSLDEAVKRYKEKENDR